MMKRNKKFKISAVIAAKILGSENDKDRDRIDKWLSEEGDNRILLDKLSDSEFRSSYEKEIGKYDSDEAWSRIEYRLVRSDEKSFPWKIVYKYAAVALLILTLSLSLNYLVFETGFFVKDRPIKLLSSNASLTLSSGETFDLTKDTIFSNDNFELFVDNQTQTIIYKENLKESSAKTSRRGLYNIIKTDIGKEYKIVLPEGTIAHLNSGSTLRFPSRFSEDSREVEAYGEVLFDVNPDKKRPFTVKSGNILIEVLGTVFNLNSYDDNGTIVTTLISGSLRVSSYDASVVIEPDQQVVFDKQSSYMTVKNVDSGIFTSWTEASIVFKDEKLVDIVKSLSRWYDFDYIFRDEQVKNVMIGMNINREEDFNKIYSTLDNIGLFNVEKRGKNLIFSSINSDY